VGEKTKEQLLKELREFQTELEKKVRHQDQMIRRFQMLTENEGLFSQIIDFCPYPIAVFTAQGILEKVNDAFTVQTGIKSGETESGKLSIYNCISGDDELIAAIRQALNGKTCSLETLNNPFLGLPTTKLPQDLPSKSYRYATVFPIPSEEGAILHGVVVFTTNL